MKYMYIVQRIDLKIIIIKNNFLKKRYMYMVYVLIDWIKYGIFIKYQFVQSIENIIFKFVL